MRLRNSKVGIISQILIIHFSSVFVDGSSLLVLREIPPSQNRAEFIAPEALSLSPLHTCQPTTKGSSFKSGFWPGFPTLACPRR